jgi:hypothetical protein
MTSSESSGRGARRDTPGEGRTEASKQKTPGPRLPHERDESADSQATVPAPAADVGAQAHEDLARGLEDTGRGPVMDEVYRRRVKPGPPRKSPRRIG